VNVEHRPDPEELIEPPGSPVFAVREANVVRITPEMDQETAVLHWLTRGPAR
jgi:hypothetical protein